MEAKEETEAERALFASLVVAGPRGPALEVGLRGTEGGSSNGVEGCL